MEKLNMSMEELESFFDKYNSLELESINNMFKFLYGYELKAAKKILEEVYRKKDHKCDTFDRSYKIKQLNDKELTLLYELTDSTLMGLTSIKTPNSEKEVTASSNLLNNIEFEMDRRKESKKVKVLSLNK